MPGSFGKRTQPSKETPQDEIIEINIVLQVMILTNNKLIQSSWI